MGHIFERYPYNISSGLHGQGHGGSGHRRDHHFADGSDAYVSDDRGGWVESAWAMSDPSHDEYYFGEPQLSDNGAEDYSTSTETSVDGGADAESYLSSSLAGAIDPNNSEQ
eukprot:1668090-Amphidinium_carterae.2